MNNNNRQQQLASSDTYNNNNNESFEGMGSYHALHNKHQDPTEVTIRTLDADIVIRGYRQRVALTLLVWLLIFLTAGMLGILLLYWKPDWMLKLTHSVCPLTSAQLISIEDAYQQKYVRKLYITTSSTAAPSAGGAKSASEVADSLRAPKFQQIKMFLPVMFTPPQKLEKSKKNYEKGVYTLSDEGVMEKVDDLHWFRFQKHKYFWDAAAVTFRPLVGPSSVKRALIDTDRGLCESEAFRRQMLFGRNELIIKVASPISVLILEALNPFYIFQVYSFIVWYTENYIYYAWCIVAMSALSLLYTTWQTYQLQKMRRNRFQTSGTVQVLRHDGDDNSSTIGTTNNNIRRRQSGTVSTTPNGAVNYAVAGRTAAHEQQQDTSSAETNNTSSTNSRSSISNGRRKSYDAVEKPLSSSVFDGDTNRDAADVPAQLPVTNGHSNGNGVAVEKAAIAARRSNMSHQHRGSPTKTTSVYETTVESRQLVPGDIIIIPSHGCEMYCDAILLTGTCLVNEATLTGESVPVSKAALEWHGSGASAGDEPVDADADETPDFAQQRLYYLSLTSSGEQRAAGGTSKNMLYSGTKVIQTRYYGNEPVKAIVMRTGYCTVKGELVRSILYPKPVDFSFHSDAMRFLAVLAVFACIGMIYTFIMLKHFGSTTGRLFLRALDVVTIVVPPALPFAMTMGIVHAQNRLRKAGLFCISPRMINMAGSINLVCFDKTGTLTEEGLSLRGVIPVAGGAGAGNSNKNSEDNATTLRLAKLIPAEAISPHTTAADDDAVSRHNTLHSTSVRDADGGGYRNASFSTDADNSQSDAAMLPNELTVCMATCHELTLVDGALTGDPLDLEMFRATGWQLEEPDVSDSTKFDQFVPTIVHPPSQSSRKNVENTLGDISILRVMSFESKLQRMSVIIRRAAAAASRRNNDNDSGAERFCVCAKGAPEKVASLCDKSSLPANFNEQLTFYTQNGDRVLALAYRNLDAGMRITKIQRLSRDAIERELVFLGFIVFENRLKPQTVPCIRELKAASIRPVMVTGDNLLTALSVARQCNVIDTPVVSLLDIVEGSSADGDHVNRPKLRRRVMATAPPNSAAANNNNVNGPVHASETPLSALNHQYNPLSSISNANNNIESVGANSSSSYCCAVTGDTFQALREAGSVGKGPADYYHLLHHGAVFARMTPAQKEMLVEDLRHAGYFVGMCGDGANDCGALKTAHMGISLSDQEASAAAPYTYKHANVSCVPICIKEGRAALDTSFAAFKYMAAYSLTQFLSVLILYATNTNLSDFDFLYIDLFQVTIIVIVFGLTKASPKLVRTPPPARLLGLIPLLSLLSQMTITLGIQVAAYLIMKNQPYYTSTVDVSAAKANPTLAIVSTTSTTTTTTTTAIPQLFSVGNLTLTTTASPDTDDSGNLEHYFSYQNYAVFSVSTFQYVWLAVAFSRGLPYRRLIFTNWMLTVVCVLMVAFDAYLILYPCSWLIWLFEIKLPPTWNFRWVIIGLAVGNFLLCIICEWWLLALLNRYLDRQRRVHKEEWRTSHQPVGFSSSSTHGDNFSAPPDATRNDRNGAGQAALEMERVESK